MNRQAYMPLFVGDFLASTAMWEGEERALYVLALAYQWVSGPLPSDLKRLAKVLQYDQETFDRLWQAVGVKFDPCTAGVANARLEAHRVKAASISAKNSSSGKAGAGSRWRKGGGHSDEANGERHSESVANATPNANGESDGERHESSMAFQSNPIQSNPRSEGGSDFALLQTQTSERTTGSRKSPDQRIPDDFELTPERRKFAEQKGLAPQPVFAHFLAYWRAEGGAKARKRDWDQAWQVWCLNEATRLARFMNVRQTSAPARAAKSADELEREAARASG